MILLSLGHDPKLFEEGSAVANRQKEYAKLVDELHIVSYTQFGYRVTKLGENAWAYPTNSKRRFSYLWDGYKICRDIVGNLPLGHPGVIVTSQDGITNLLAIILNLRFGFHFEMQVHTDIFSKYFRKESLGNLMRLFGFWLGTRRASSVRVVSKRIKTNLVIRWKVDKRKIRILPIFIDASRFQKSTDTTNPVNNLRKEYPNFSHIILMASRLSREKNLPLALSAFKEVRKKFSEAGLVIVGDGPLINQITGDRVVVRPWEKDLVPLYKTSDIFLLTSDYEGYGLTLVEAALSGTPIVTTDVGVVGDYINAHNALIAPPRDYRKLAAHIIFLLQNESARVMMRERLRKVADHLLAKEDYLKALKQNWLI